MTNKMNNNEYNYKYNLKIIYHINMIMYKDDYKLIMYDIKHLSYKFIFF
jgi:hypothetical protein